MIDLSNQVASRVELAPAFAARWTGDRRGLADYLLHGTTILLHQTRGYVIIVIIYPLPGLGATDAQSFRPNISFTQIYFSYISV